MKKIYVILISCFALMNISCEKESLADLTYFGEGFKGITFTNSEGGLWSYDLVDPSDWCIIKMEGEPVPDEMVSYKQFEFGPAYPNPTNGQITIRFTLPKAMHVKIYIINSEYQILDVALDEEIIAGNHSINFDTDNLPGGVYRAVIEADNIKCTGDIWVYRPEF